MQYSFTNLSPDEFEALSADLVGRDFGVRFERFGAGPDDGIDGRFVSEQGGVILQAKHYEKTGYSGLKSKMKAERVSIDALSAERYILTTSVSLTPRQKAELADIIGPSLKGPGDIFGKEDLDSLLRANQDLVRAFPALWKTTGEMLKAIVSEVLSERGLPALPHPLATLMQTKDEGSDASTLPRDTLFLIAASPCDDDLVLWLGPRLEARGYRVFANLLTLEPGDRWRQVISKVLEHRAAKVLVLCSKESLSNDGVQDQIDHARDVATTLGDARFIIPLRLQGGQKISGLRDAVVVDFAVGWREGLATLEKTLQRQKVPRNDTDAVVDRNWEVVRKRGAAPLVTEPERLTSNWVNIVEMPDEIRFYESAGHVAEDQIKRRTKGLSYPVVPHGRGILTFASPLEIEEDFSSLGRFHLRQSIPIEEFVRDGDQKLKIKSCDASAKMVQIINDAWTRYCRDCGMIEYDYSNSLGFHISPDQVANGERVKFGQQGDRRSVMLRNVARKHVWQFGVTAFPSFWPYWHMKMKARVLFAQDNSTPMGIKIDDSKKMHRLRRSICKGWRNKQWQRRLLATLEVLAGDSAYIRVPLAPGRYMSLASEPALFTSPVSTKLPDLLDADGEEIDESTLGRPEELWEEDA